MRDLEPLALLALILVCVLGLLVFMEQNVR
jgi:hypothetical protein